MRTIRLRHPGGVSRIDLKRGLLRDEAALSKAIGSQRKFLVVTNRKIKRLHGRTVTQGLGSLEGFSGTFLIPDGEHAKDIRIAQKLYDKLIAIGFDRSNVLVALGGGVCTDLTGFVASTFLRGVPWVAIPTTLVGQIDAALGGKTAVNHPRGKNLIGTFCQPERVVIDPGVLGTLERSHWVDGLAELIKYGMIADPAILATMERNLAAVLDGKENPMDRLIARCVRIKANVVEQDEKDQGRRHILNFGHTLAHALETQGRYQGLSHGRAVAIGMVFAANVAVITGRCENKVRARLIHLLSAVGLAPPVRKMDHKALVRIMALDKKRTGGRILMVLPVRAGKVVLRDMPLKQLENQAFWCFESEARRRGS